MDYKTFLDTIYQRHSSNVKLGLERMEAILERMDSPHKKLSGLHIAGTNGKGSVSAMCEAMALEHGQTTGMNTSPHLIDYCERFRINGQNIDYQKLLEIYFEWQKDFDETEASFFEISTAMAFYIFHREQVDTAIFEVGLGGRLDGTNPFKSTVSVITGISIDHPKSLGDSIELIAREKAGIIKPRTPLIMGRMPEIATDVILESALMKQVPVLQYGVDFTAENIHVDLTGTRFDYQSGWMGVEINDIRVNLLGEHQATNAATAITAFINYMNRRGLPYDLEKIRSALNKVNWMGRMQVLRTEPTVIIDGAHNEEGVKALVDNVRKMFPEKRLLFVVAILRDKKLDRMIEDICTIASKLFIAKNQSDRAADIEEQADVARQTKTPFEVADGVMKAVGMAMSEASKDDIVIVTGSLYTIAEVLAKQEELS